MSVLELRIAATQHSKRIIYLQDITGPYDPGTNPNGWRPAGDTTSPAVSLSDVADIGSTPGIVILLKKGAITYSYSDTAAMQALGFPNASNGQIALEASNFGLETFPDGKITLTAQVAGEYTYDDNGTPITDGFHSSKSVELWLYKQGECCVENLLILCDQGCPDICEDPKWKSYTRAEVAFTNAKRLGDSQQWDAAESALSELQTICSQENACCNGH